MKNKKAAQDFTKNNLPKNRKEVFKTCYKLFFKKILLIGFLLLLFSLPLLITSFVCDYLSIGLKELYLSSSLTQTEYQKNLFWLRMIGSCIGIIGVIILAIGISGAMRVIRQMVWDEPIFLISDFFEGIRQNFKTYLIIGLFMGLINIYNIFVFSVDLNIVILQYVPIGIQITFLFPIFMYVSSLSIVYKNSFKGMLKNGFIFTIKKFPLTLVFSFFLCCFLSAHLISYIVIKYAILIISTIFVLPLFIILWVLFSFSVFDKYINNVNHPEIYEKGIYKI
ncbi:MAG: DUF624 domain-containing protein [Treponema sp.]|nr:DUF624 domain-containing protein [Treponema sp.]